MEYKMDLSRFCFELLNREVENDIEEICDTAGERYLYNSIIRKFITGAPVRVDDVDFSAFSEDDIVDLTDNKSAELYNIACGAFKIADGFIKSNPIAVKKRRFF